MLGRKLRLGMVGGGPGAFIGEVHRIASRFDGRFELVASALSSNPEKSRAYAAQIGIARAYGSYAEMAREEAKRPDPIDVVCIVTPNNSHFDIARSFLDKGIHVMCDKPMTTTLDDAEALAAQVARSGLIFGLTYTYSGYPLVRMMRQLVKDGGIGKVRMINVEYAQGWLATDLENDGSKQAQWRTDPARSGPAGCLGDIATHAYHTACFVTGLMPQSISAELTTFVPGRRLDDNVQAMIRFEGGSKAMLWSSQIALGNENNLNIRIFGDLGSLVWEQENPNYARYTQIGKPVQILSRGGASLNSASTSRLPAGHPEGYFEAFAQLYADLAEQLTARLLARSVDPAALLLPSCTDGVSGVRFIEAAILSSSSNGGWTPLR